MIRALAAGVILAMTGCSHHAPPTTLPPVVEAPVSDLPNVRAKLYTDPVYGGFYYLLEAGPSAASGPPVLFVHGLGANGVRDWYPVLAPIAARRRIAVIDLPGFGRSDRGNEYYNPDRYAQLLAYVIRRHLGGHADVVGHSMGGAIAIALAAKAPTLVRRLGLADVAGILCQESLVHELAGQSSLLHELITGFAPLMPDPEAALATPGARSRLLKGDPGRIAALGLLSTNFDPWLGQVRAPTLLIWGERDGVAPLRTFEVLAQRLPLFGVNVLPGVGHNPMTARPQPFAASLLAFLESPSVTIREPTRGVTPSHPGESVPLVCKNEQNRVYSGRFTQVDLQGCRGVVLRNATIDSLKARSSQFQLDNVEVRDGIELVDSRLEATVARVAGEPALRMRQSVADVADVTFLSRGAAVEVFAEPARLVGSVSRVHARSRAHVLHGVRQMQPGESL